MNADNKTWCTKQLESTTNPCGRSFRPINLINDTISKLKATLISIAELLKQ